MEPTDFRFPSSLAYWTVFEELTNGQRKHADRDWAAVTERENKKHIHDHLDNFWSSSSVEDAERHLRHVLARSVMLYWSFLRDNNLLDQRLQLPPEKESK